MSKSNGHPVQGTLFPQWDYLSAPEVLGMVNPHLPALACTLMESWLALQDLRSVNTDIADWDEGDCAVLLTRFAQTRADRIFKGVKGIRLRPFYRKVVIEIDNRLAVIVKKLTMRRRHWDEKPRLTRSNVDTKRCKKLYLQAQQQDLPEMPRIVFGYVFEEVITNIRFVLAYPRSKSRGFEWVHPIPPQGNITLGVFSPEPDGDDEDDKGYTVGPAVPGEATGTGKEPDDQ
jgi:hypothetical protein